MERGLLGIRALLMTHRPERGRIRTGGDVRRTFATLMREAGPGGPASKTESEIKHNSRFVSAN